MKILQINTTVNTGSTGKIAEDIGQLLMANGHESYIAYGRANNQSKSQLIKIGSQKDVMLHGLKSAMFDRHGFGSASATKKFIEEIDKLNPDAIGLHNIHGYYLNIEVLFDYLALKKIPVVWTLHDCWPFTGHCAYFDSIGCMKWETQCHNCPKTRSYPTSYGLDNSRQNYIDKKRIFNMAKGVIVTPSQWLKNITEKSFLDYPVAKIHNGLNLDVFKPQQNVSGTREKYNITGEKIILGVANIWDERKGLKDFIKLQELGNNAFSIVLVGLSEKQIESLPKGITGIKRTENVQELIALYSLADIFVNPTYQDNFPTTNIEALACGTPVVTYNTGGSPEAIDAQTGVVVGKGDIAGLHAAILEVLAISRDHFRPLCRARAEMAFNKNDRYLDYLKIYENLVAGTVPMQ
jgi:putative colanic acid biosynthesis glycosyltransferase